MLWVLAPSCRDHATPAPRRHSSVSSRDGLVAAPAGSIHAPWPTPGPDVVGYLLVEGTRVPAGSTPASHGTHIVRVSPGCTRPTRCHPRITARATGRRPWVTSSADNPRSRFRPSSMSPRRVRAGRYGLSAMDREVAGSSPAVRGQPGRSSVGRALARPHIRPNSPTAEPEARPCP